MIPFWSIDVMRKSRNSVELIQDGNELIPSCFQPHYESEAKRKVESFNYEN